MSPKFDLLRACQLGRYGHARRHVETFGVKAHGGAEGYTCLHALSHGQVTGVSAVSLLSCFLVIVNVVVPPEYPAQLACGSICFLHALAQAEAKCVSLPAFVPLLHIDAICTSGSVRLCDHDLSVAEAKRELVATLLKTESGLLSSRTRWGLHALHFAAANCTDGVQMFRLLLSREVRCPAVD